jgi:hypothetical protein
MQGLEEGDPVRWKRRWWMGSGLLLPALKGAVMKKLTVEIDESLYSRFRRDMPFGFMRVIIQALIKAAVASEVYHPGALNKIAAGIPVRLQIGGWPVESPAEETHQHERGTVDNL